MRNPLDTLNPRKRHEQQAQVKAELVERALKYRRVFGSEDGRWVLEDLRKRSFMDQTTYHDVAHRMSFNEGRRSLFVHIHNNATKDPNSIVAELQGERNG